MGSGGLRARLIRHINSRDKPKHWHIDYLLAHAHLNRILWSVSDITFECAWAGALRQLFDLPIPGFGASDCRCGGHLFHLGRRPKYENLQRTLEKVAENDEVSYEVTLRFIS